MRNDEDTARLERIREQTRAVLLDTLGVARDVAIVDAPNQRNVGDSLIWAGELAYLEQIGCRIHYVSDLRGFDAESLRRNLPANGVILLHGGGNFGDLWPGHQMLREHVAAELSDYRIVQLPQSIFFGDPDRAAHAHSALSKHPDFTVLLRDSLSIERAAHQLPDLRVVFCPDMALGYEPPVPLSSSVPSGVLVIARADHESSSGLSSIQSDFMRPLAMQVTDWWLHASEPLEWRRARTLARTGTLLVRARRKARRVLGVGVPVPQVPQHRLQQALVTINRLNLEHALNLYSPASGMLMDRLHAHVLAVLLGVNHVMLDNTYRKLGAVYDDYTHVFSTAHYSTNLEDARSQLHRVMEA